MRKSIHLLAGALAITVSGVAAASPDWQYVEAGYTPMDFDGNESFEPDGLAIEGKYALNQNVYLNGEYRFFEEGNFDFNMLTVGGGYRMPVNSTTDAYFGANLERVDSDGYDDTGYSVSAGLRSMITEQVELMGEIGYYDVDEGDATFKFGGNYYITPHWAVGASYEVIDEIDIMQVTARYAF